MATDVKLNECGDVDIQNRDLVLIRGVDAIRQSWLIHIRTFLGEWFLDPSIGLPYLQKMFGKAVSRATLKQLFTTASLQVPGVLQVVGVQVNDIDPVTRSVDVTVTAIIEGESDSQEFTFTGDVASCVAAAMSPASFSGLRIWFDFDDASSILAYTPGTLLQVANKAGPGDGVGDRTGAGSPSLVGASPMGGRTALRLHNDVNDPSGLDLGDHFRIRDVPAIRSDLGFDGSITVVSAFLLVQGTDDITRLPYALRGVQSDGVTREYYNAKLMVGGPPTGFAVLPDDVSYGTSVSYTEYLPGTTTPDPDEYEVFIHSWTRDFSGATSPAERSQMFNGYEFDRSNNANPVKQELDGYGVIGAGYQSAEDIHHYFNGFFGELLVYDRALTAAELSSLHDLLLLKWGGTKILP